jgi:hypothetical protein
MTEINIRVTTAPPATIEIVPDLTAADVDTIAQTIADAAAATALGQALRISQNLADLSNPAVARGNLGTDASNVPFTQTGTGAATRTIGAKLNERVSILDFGGVADGVTDNRAAIIAAVAALGSSGGVIFFPRGRYRLDTDGGTISLARVTFDGEGGQKSGDPADNVASTIEIVGTTNNPFSIGRSVTMRGMSFFWPDQVETGSAPIGYPALFTGAFLVQFTFSNNTVMNAYRFMTIPVDGIAGDCRITENRIFAIDQCFRFIGGAPETFYLADNLFSFGIYESEINVGPTYAIRDYYTNSGMFMLVDCGAGTIRQSVDGWNMHNNLVFGPRYGIRVLSGRLDVSVIEGNKWDAVPTVFSTAGTGSINNTAIDGNLIYSYRFADTAAAAVAVAIAGSNPSDFSLTGNNFAFAQGDYINMSGATSLGDAHISGNTFKDWGRTTLTPAAQYNAIGVDVSAGTLSVAANAFTANPAGSNTAIGVEVAEAETLTITSNRFSDTDYAVGITEAVDAFVSGNHSIGTIGTNAFVMNDATPGAVRASGNHWDKAPNNYAFPFFTANINAAQTFTGAATKANFAQINGYPVTLDYDTGTSTFTAPDDGLYEFAVSMTNSAAVTSGDVWDCRVEALGSATQRRGQTRVVTSAAIGSCAFSFTGRFRLVAGDTVTVQMTRRSGSGNWVNDLNGENNYFTGTKIQ